MGIHTSGAQMPHWNYFIALEDDLDRASRYVEFTAANFKTYSIEFAHLMFAASSEVEVVLKKFCLRYAPKRKPKNIDEYRSIVLGGDDAEDWRLKDLPQHMILLPRFGLELRPWENWSKGTNPIWWRDYNQVKHSRHEAFAQANLHNALNALAALFLLAIELGARPETQDGRLEIASIHLSRMEPRPKMFWLPHGSTRGRW